MSSGTTSKKVLFLIVFVDLLGFGIMIPMLPFYARSFGASAFEIGLLMFVYSFIQIFMGPVWGGLSDRYGRRPILLLTILGQALAMIWAGFATSLWMLLLTRALAGLFAGNISTASAMMADLTSREDRAKGMGLIGAAFGLGFVFGPALGGFLISYGYEWPSIAAGMIGIVNFIWAVQALKEAKKTTEERKKNRRKFSWEAVRKVFQRKAVYLPVLMFLFLTLAFVHLEITFGLFVLDRFHLSEREAGYLLAFMGVVMAIVQGGLIGRLTQAFSEKRIVFGGIFLILMGLGGIIISWELWPLIISLVLLAIGYSLTNPCLSAATSKSAPADQQGSTLGVYQSAGSLARVIGPLSAGYLYDVSLIYPFIGAIGVVGVCVFFWLQWAWD